MVHFSVWDVYAHFNKNVIWHNNFQSCVVDVLVGLVVLSYNGWCHPKAWAVNTP